MKGLILDDEDLICGLIAAALERPGVDYDIYLDPLDALRHFDESHYDFAFVDIQLPHMDGLEFSRHFKDRFPEADLIIITGFGDYDKAVQAIKVGAYDYIEKPFRLLDINLCVTHLIEKRDLYENQKRMGVLRFANDVALQLMHELRNPLAAIGGLSRVVFHKDLPVERMKHLTRKIYDETLRVEKVLKEILAHLVNATVRPCLAGNDPERPASPAEHEDESTVSCKEGEVPMAQAPEKACETENEKGREPMTKTKKERSPKKQAAPTTGKVLSRKTPAQELALTSTGIQKEYLKSGKMCRVTFRLPDVCAPDAKSVCIVGDFNDWNTRGNAMKQTESGDYTITLDLEPGKEYQFRYLIDESKWENDWNADKYVKNPFGDSDNSVVVV